MNEKTLLIIEGSTLDYTSVKDEKEIILRELKFIKENATKVIKKLKELKQLIYFHLIQKSRFFLNLI